MAKKFRIYAGVGAGRIFFDGSRVPPAPLGGKVVAEVNPFHSDRVRISRTDQFAKDGVTPKRLFKGLKAGRIKNEANQILLMKDLLHNKLLTILMTRQTRKQTKLISN